MPGATRTHRRQLHDKLQRAADDRSQRQNLREARQRRLIAEDDERADHRGVPHDRRGVRQQEAAVAVEHAEAPRGEHEQAGAGKQDANEPNRQLALLALEPGRDDVDEERRREHADEDDDAHREREKRGHRARHPVGVATLAAGEERGVHGNERRRQRAFAEQVLQEIGNAERGAERVGFDAQAEIVREDPLPDEAGQPRQQDAGRDEAERRAPAGVEPLPSNILIVAHGSRRACRSTSSSDRT